MVIAKQTNEKPTHARIQFAPTSSIILLVSHLFQRFFIQIQGHRDVYFFSPLSYRKVNLDTLLWALPSLWNHISWRISTSVNGIACL